MVLSELIFELKNWKKWPELMNIWLELLYKPIISGTQSLSSNSEFLSSRVVILP